MRKVLPFLIIVVVAIGVVTCKKFAEPEAYEEPVVPPTSNFPQVEIDSITDITTSAAKFSCKVTFDGGVTVIDRGVCWSTEHNPTFEGNHVSSGIGVGSYTCDVTEFEHATKYYVKAYAINSYGTGYSEEMEVSILPYLPDVTTKTVTNFSLIDDVFQAECGGKVTDDGGGTILVGGVCWGLSNNPDLSGDHTTDSVGSEEFISIISGLNAHKTYYVRAYATNENGTSYGNTISFTTPSGLPALTTYNASNITHNSATCGGNVSLDGGFPILERGVCWSAGNTTPTINGSHTSDGTGTGEFTSSLTDLQQDTKYHARAYARNINGISYGGQISFTTSRSVPTVITNTVYDITPSGATTGGNITNEGISPVIYRGVCWSRTNSNPTINNSHTLDGEGTGSFVSVLTGLLSNTTYYVRAYATNSEGTGYGTTRVFKTNADRPVVTTGSVTSLLSNSAIFSNNSVEDEGSSPVTARGMCYTTSPTTPTLNNASYTTDGSGSGLYNTTISGLSANTIYYARAYATNASGTSYGEVIGFKTKQ